MFDKITIYDIDKQTNAKSIKLSLHWTASKTEKYYFLLLVFYLINKITNNMKSDNKSIAEHKIQLEKKTFLT